MENPQNLTTPKSNHPKIIHACIGPSIWSDLYNINMVIMYNSGSQPLVRGHLPGGRQSRPNVYLILK